MSGRGTCSVCTEERVLIACADGCAHSFCQECIDQHVVLALREWQASGGHLLPFVSCMGSDCSAPVLMTTMLRLLAMPPPSLSSPAVDPSTAALQQHERAHLLTYLECKSMMLAVGALWQKRHDDGSVWHACPRHGCHGFGFRDSDRDVCKSLVCPVCAHQFCGGCLRPSHQSDCAAAFAADVEKELEQWNSSTSKLAIAESSIEALGDVNEADVDVACESTATLQSLMRDVSVSEAPPRPKSGEVTLPKRQRKSTTALDHHGHLFVVKANILKLACDAILIPCDGVGDHNIVGPLSENAKSRYSFQAPKDFGEDGCRCVIASNYKPGSPTPYLTVVNSQNKIQLREDIFFNWMIVGVAEFLRKALDDFTSQGKSARNRRAKPLFALPYVGTGVWGTAHHRAGTVLKHVLPFLATQAQALQVDIAFVTFGDEDHFAAQSLRQTLPIKHFFHGIDNQLFAEAVKLADLAVGGELVLFIGAGMSAGAGLPMWGQLLSSLAKRCQMSDAEVAKLKKLNFLDQAIILEMRLGGPDKLQQEVANQLKSTHVSLAQCLVANLPVREAVTTNYDDLYEQAHKPFENVSVLPYDAVKKQEKWILKLHGCVYHSEDIVLTRQDYMRFSERRAALSGIVQTLLITKHMLFIGFSLCDENFHKIMDSVRLARHDREYLGTAISLVREPLQEELWDTELTHVTMGGTWAATPDIGMLARRLDIFLDLVNAMCVRSSRHILNKRFDTLLSDHDRAFGNDLRAALQSFSPEGRQSDCFKMLVKFAEGLGYTEAASTSADDSAETSEAATRRMKRSHRGTTSSRV